MRLAARWTTWLPLCLGAGLLVWLLYGMELRPAWEAVARIGWRIVVLVPLSLLWMIPNAIAWGYAFRAPGAAVPFLRLLAARIAGESVNDLLPSGNLGASRSRPCCFSPRSRWPSR
ncbi:MAG: flippase-like domain-containing protein [Elusimicrobiota bacterium]|nr:MAG: flippase-like domain-containing protein [Elusimicrobiota bacterium]